MKAIYDKETDTLTVVFREDAVEESDEVRPGVVLDYDRDGRLVAIELLDASKHVQDPGHVSVVQSP